MWQRQAVRHGGKFFHHVIPAIVKPLHSLWNEIIGFFYLCFAVAFGFGAYRQYLKCDGSPGPFGKLVVLLALTLAMMCFGLSAFRKARKISRS